MCCTRLLVVGCLIVGLVGCGAGSNGNLENTTGEADTSPGEDRQYLLERVDDAAVAQLYADSFEGLQLREKILIWHLYQAALAGRDIFYDQRYAHNLEMREVLEEILTHADGIVSETLDEILRYTKLFWINTGPFNNLTARKFVLDVTPDEFSIAAHSAAEEGAVFPLGSGETLDERFTSGTFIFSSCFTRDCACLALVAFALKRSTKAFNSADFLS